MAKPWREVIASPQYQALPDAEKAAAQEEYFSTVVAPQAGAAAEQARAEFFKAYPIGPAKPRESVFDLQQRAMRGDADARTEYDRRAAAVGQNSLQQEQAANNPANVEGDFFGGKGNFWEGVGSSFVNTGYGLAQLGLQAGNKLGLVDNSWVSRIQQDIDRNEAVQATLLDTAGGLTGNITGNVAQFAAGGAALAPFKAPAAAGLGTRMLTAAANGGVGGGAIASTQPVVSGRTRMDNISDGVGYGMLGGAGGTLVGAGVSRIGASQAGQRVSKELRDLWDKAKAAGVDLYPHQVSDSRAFKTMASVLGQLPFTGGQAANRKQVDQYTKMVAKLIGQDADAITPEVQAAAKAANAKLYSDALEGVDIPMGNSHISALRAERNYPGRYTEEQKRLFDDIERQWAENSAGGTMSGRVYQELRDGLKAGRNDASIAARKILEGIADSNMPAQAREAWKAANRLYANRQVVKKAMQGADSPVAKVSTEYKVNPSTFRSAIGTKYPPTKEADEVSRLGQLIKDPVPDSGTAGRAVVATALGTAGYSGGIPALTGMAKLAGIGLVAGRAVNSRPLARVMQSPALERARTGAGRAIEYSGKQIEKRSPMLLASGSAGVAAPAYAEPDQFNAELRRQIAMGEISKPEAAAKLDAYLQIHSQKNGIDTTRAVFKQYPEWSQILNY